MRVPIQVHALEEGGYIAVVPGISLFEGHGETPEEAIHDAMDWASLYLECKEPEMLEFEVDWSSFRDGDES